MKEQKIKEVVRAKYSQIAEQDQQTCCASCGCGVSPLFLAETVGYTPEDLKNIPEEAVMGLGCGNPVALATLIPGETVLDLGSGAGIDVFLAANRVGLEGRVIGVDVTQAMINRANTIAEGNGYQNVEFRLGEIEKLPVDDNSVDTIISNCVINLSPDKSKVFQEAYRVLRPGGWIIVSDIVAERALSDEMRSDLDAWAGCVSGALEKEEYLGMITQAGFSDIEIPSIKEFYVEDASKKEMVKFFSITVSACKH